MYRHLKIAMCALTSLYDKGQSKTQLRTDSWYNNEIILYV